MQKTLLLALALVTCSLTIFNFTTIEKRSVAMTFMGEEPVLPETPFAYSDVEFPEHLLNPDPDEDTTGSGYSAMEIDFAAFESVTDHGATLGRVLFYDEKLSALENISCGSCHIQELSFADNAQFSQGVERATKRNSMNLNDIAWTNDLSFFWDMSHTDLHEMIRLPLKDENEVGAEMPAIAAKMELTSYYPELFEAAYGDSEITEERIVDALVQFLKSMNTFDSRFDNEANVGFAGFTDQELEGKSLFATHCNTCHVEGRRFGEQGIFEFEFFPFFFNNGIVDENDRGTGEWFDGMNDLFKLPSLRNIAKTGPYMHDGRFETLDDVMEHYSSGVEANEWSIFIPDGGFNFTEDQKDALVAFMETLTDESFLTDEKWSDPFDFSSSSEDLDFQSSITMYPNPTMDRAVITIDGEQRSKDITVKITDENGVEVHQGKMNEGFFEITKQNLQKGIYFVVLTDGVRKSTQKLIVQ